MEGVGEVRRVGEVRGEGKEKDDSQKIQNTTHHTPRPHNRKPNSKPIKIPNKHSYKFMSHQRWKTQYYQYSYWY